MSEKICPVCHTALPEEAKFCFNCGAKVSVEKTSYVIVCEICGFENSPDSRYCISCGSRLTGEFAEKSEEIEYKPQVKAPEPKKEKVRKKRNRVNVSFNQVFYIGLAVVFVGLIAYGVMKRERKETNVHQQSQVANSEIMAEIDRLRERVNSNPDDMASTLKLANLLHDVHIFDQAVEYYRRYLAKNEKDPDARVDLGICLFELGKADEAIAEMEKALSYSPNHQLALYNLGVVNLATGKIDKAREYFQRCIDVNPSAEVAQKAKRMLEQHKF